MSERRDKILRLALCDNVSINDGSSKENPPAVEEQIDILHSAQSEALRESPLTLEQQLVVAEMENLGFTGSGLFENNCAADIPLCSHSTTLSVFTINNEIAQDQLDISSVESRQQLTPLFTPISSVQPLETVLESSDPTINLNDDILRPTLIDSEDDDSVADPDYVPSDTENQPSPTSIQTQEPISMNNLLDQLPIQVESPLSVAINISHQEGIISPLVKRNIRKAPETWKKNTRKIKRNSGVEYNTAKGKNKPARKCSNDPCKCQKACHLKIDNDARQSLFVSYWGLGSLDRQRDFLAKNVTSTEATGSRVVNSRRKFTLHYSFKIKNEKVVVCQPFFLMTLDISDKMVRTALKKSHRGVGEIQSPDKRGRHQPSNKYEHDKIQFANNHIDLFPVVPSHWCRKDTKKVYLESTLNKEKMYELYKQHCLENDKNLICKTSYKELILAKNIDFHKPRKDQCWCHKYEQLPEEEQKEKQEEYEEHINRKEYAKQEKTNDKMRATTDRTLLVCTFDFEAVLYCPLVLGKPVFYKRKLGSMNFTIHNAVTKQGYCYFWPEFEGNRGANEVSTCLYDFIKKLTDVENLVLYSDCCPGQNRNSVVAIMLNFIIMSPENNIKIIDYKFLEPGHTYMECDNMHSAIERASEYAKIYIPEDWQNVIWLARKENPYKVNIMDHTDFLDFKAMRGASIANTIKATDGTVLKWTNVRWLQVRKDVPDSLYFKSDYWEEFKEVKLKKKITRSECSSFITTKLYPEQVLLKQIKDQDLMAMCQDMTIPKNYHNYYENLPVKESVGAVADNARDSNDEMALSATRAIYLKRRPRRNN